MILPALRRLKAGQEIREVGPKWHATKAGTPTMGGLMFIIGIAAAIIAAGWRGFLEGNLTHIYLFLFSSVFGVIGFLGLQPPQGGQNHPAAQQGRDGEAQNAGNNGFHNSNLPLS